MSGYNGMELPKDWVVMSKDDFLNICEQMVQYKLSRKLNLKEAAAAYGHDAKTICKRIEQGLIKAEKVGGNWEIESPAARDIRLKINNN